LHYAFTGGVKIIKFKISRRDFLKTSGLLGAALVLEESQIGLLRKTATLALAPTAEEAEEKVIHSICVMDHWTCGIDVVVRNGRAVKVYGSKTGYGLARNMGRLCPKGNSGLAYTYDPKRVRYPMKRVGERGEGKWQRISYDEATDIIAAKLLEVKEKYGAKAIVTGGWEAPKNWSAYASRFGMTLWSTASATCPLMHWCASWLTGFPRLDTVGYGWWYDYPNTDLMIHWAVDQNIYRDAKALGDIEFLDAKERGAKLIVIDPRFSILASKADVWIPIKPGYDGALILGMLNVIINEELYDADFIRDWTVGFEDFGKYVQEFPPEKVEQTTGILADTIRDLAREYATTPRACIYTSRSVMGQHSNGVDTCRLLHILIAITGHLDTLGSNLFNDPMPPLWPANSSLISSTGLASVGGNPVQAMQLPEQQAGQERYPIAHRAGCAVTYPEFLDMLFKGEIQALYATGQNYLGIPNNKAAWKKLREIPFIAVCDLHMTPIAEIAEVIIPGSSFMESMAVYTEGRDYYALRLTEPIPNPLTEMSEEDASLMLMKKLGMEKVFPYESWEEQISKRELKAKGIPLTAKEMIAQFPAGIVVPVKREYKKYEKGLVRKDGKPGFETPSGKFEIRSIEAEKYGYNPVPNWWEPWELREEERKEFPLILDPGERTWFYGCARTGHINPWNAVSYLSEMVPEPSIRLSEQDAEERGIKDGDMVIVTGRCSATETASIKLRAKIPPPHGDIMPGVCSMLDGFVAAPATNLLPDFSLPEAYDPIAGNPPLRGILVQVRKA
jgi:anaerobic selenocysteine-containing dehydrogenase